MPDRIPLFHSARSCEVCKRSSRSQKHRKSETLPLSFSVFAAFLCLQLVSVFAVHFLNAVHVLSNQWRCFLNLLVFHLFACVFLSCCLFALVNHRSYHRICCQINMQGPKRSLYLTCLSLDCGRKLEHPEKSHPNANHCTTVLPLIIISCWNIQYNNIEKLTAIVINRVTL